LKKLKKTLYLICFLILLLYSGLYDGEHCPSHFKLNTPGSDFGPRIRLKGSQDEDKVGKEKRNAWGRKKRERDGVMAD
jgi:hypothetical protein